MKHIFVLDENILIQSHNCKSVNGSEDTFDSLNLVINILEKCHKIGLSNELIAKYQEWLKKLKEDGTNIPAVNLWRHFFTKEKSILCDNHLNNLPSNLEHDRHVIEPALFLKGTLVTTDGKLKEKWNAWTESNRYRLDIKPPKEALDFLSRSNP